MRTRIRLGVFLLITACVTSALGQAVDVTMSLDQAALVPGQQTTLRVFARIDPSLAAQADRIFSWYIDVESDNDVAVTTDYESLLMSASDNIPATSSSGTSEGADRRGIHNTFMALPGAGKASAVELAAIPVTATAAGTVTYSVQAGTTVTNLSEDFIVAPTGGGNPFTGGDYATASAVLTVTSGTQVELSIAPISGGVTIFWTPAPGNQYLQFTDTYGRSPTWTPFPGGPHNGGTVVDRMGERDRTYRLVSDP